MTKDNQTPPQSQSPDYSIYNRMMENAGWVRSPDSGKWIPNPDGSSTPIEELSESLLGTPHTLPADNLVHNDPKELTKAWRTFQRIKKQRKAEEEAGKQEFSELMGHRYSTDDELTQAWRDYKASKTDEWNEFPRNEDNIEYLDALDDNDITEEDISLAEQELRHSVSDTHPHTPPSILSSVDRSRIKERFHAVQEQRKRREKRAEIAGLLPQYTDSIVEQLLLELEHDWNMRRVGEEQLLLHDFTVYKELWLRSHLEAGMITHRQFTIHSEMSIIEFARTFHRRIAQRSDVYINWHQNWIDQWFHHVRETYAKRADEIKRTTADSMHQVYIDGEEAHVKSVDVETGEVAIHNPLNKGQIIGTMIEVEHEATFNPAYFHSQWHDDYLDEDGIYRGGFDGTTQPNSTKDDDTID